MPKMTPLVLAIIALLFIVMVPVCYAAKRTDALDLRRVVEAIRQVENTPTSKIGAGGERSEWQITEGVWKEWSSQPFWWASSHLPKHRAEQFRVALRHVTWIHEHLFEIPLRETAYSVALVYSAGWKTVKHGAPAREKRYYAQRVQNIYNELSSE